MGTIALYIFFIALFWVLTPYLIYPMWQMVFPGKHKGYSYTESAPKVSVIFAAYNERAVIVEKIESIFTTNYPQEQVEVWIGSDLSDDGQDDIIRSLQSKYPNLHLHINAVRSGKSATINKLVELCDGEVIIATDANIIFNEKTIEELVRPIATGEYAAVAGNLSYDSNTIEGNTAKTEKVYLNLENKIRLAESNKYGFCLGMEGGLYSMHKSLWKPIPPNTFMEDFFQTVQLIQREKCIYYNPKAFGFEDVSTSLKEEFKRKTRISIGNFQNLNRFKALVHKESISIWYRIYDA
jgi:cellulose synthase/poly-beta-1,6-N-acetylglucosamine synthase-like glycosyltransferase